MGYLSYVTSFELKYTLNSDIQGKQRLSPDVV